MEKYFRYKQKYIDLKNTLEGGTAATINNISSDILFHTSQFMDCKELINLLLTNKELFKNTIIDKGDILSNITVTKDLIERFKTTDCSLCSLDELNLNPEQKKFCNLFYNKCFVYTFAKKFIDNPNIEINEHLLNTLWLREEDNPEFQQRLIQLGANSYNIVVHSVDSRLQGNEIVIPVGTQVIAYYAYHRRNITSLSIPNSVVIIDKYVFAGNQLTDLVIPNSVVRIDTYAFAENQLTNLVIPNSVKKIGDLAFAYNSINNLTIGESVETIGDSAFAKNKIINLVIPNSVKNIGYRAFADNKIINLVIPNSVISIDDHAFFSFRPITTVTMPKQFNNNNDKKRIFYKYQTINFNYT